MLEIVINQRIPHISQEILAHFDTPTLIQYRTVSTLWKELCENIIASRWRDLIFPTFKHGEMEIFAILLEYSERKKIDWNVRDESGRTPLMLACEWGQTHIVKTILTQKKVKIDVNAQDKFGWTPLVWACDSKQAVIISFLLKNSKELELNLDAKRIDGRTVFHFVKAEDKIVALAQKNGNEIHVLG